MEQSNVNSSVPPDEPCNAPNPAVSKIELAYLNLWIADRLSPENKNKKDNNRWMEIGEEVLLRKTLFISALKDLEKHDVKGDIHNLAATDVFVEKASKIITRRAKWLIGSGGVVTAIIAGILCWIGIYIKTTNFAEDIYNYKISYVVELKKNGFVKSNYNNSDYLSVKDALSKPIEIDGLTFTLLMFKKISLGAFFIGVAVLLAYIVRALFHEGFTLYSKRHSLRFGRLYVYLKHGNIDFSELQEAFQWNKEFPTAFRDIKPDLLSKTILSIFPEITKNLAEVVKGYYEEKNEKKRIIAK
ncbi:MAG: hypothetical protein NT004_14810 [Bacteroidetes bacterium]|nr:hypothetical protein [Bacteroidota bacterium]